jgi:hypothetical protein
MFTHPEHIIDIHKRQVLEATREQSHGGSTPTTAAPKQRPSNGRTLFGRFRAMLSPSATRQITAPGPTLSAQK